MRGIDVTHQRSRLKGEIVLGLNMSAIPAPQLAALAALSGYDQMLQIDQLARQYSIDGEEVKRQLATLSVQNSSTVSSGYNAAGEYDPSAGRSAPIQQHKEDPFDMMGGQTNNASTANIIEKKNLQFEYDPTEGAKQRREQVDQAIMCPACGVKLGIPSTRPIKVTCPQCLHEATFTA